MGVVVVGFILSLWSCNSKPSSHEEMIQLLKQQRDVYSGPIITMHQSLSLITMIR